MTKTGGGVGTNQYQVRGSSSITDVITPVVAVMAELGRQLKDSPSQVMKQIQDPACTTETLERIVAAIQIQPVRDMVSWDANSGFLFQVARHPNLGADTARRLMESADIGVRGALARNRSSPSDILTTLAGDRRKDTRTATAANLSTPREVLQSMRTDKAWEVRAALATNPNASPEALARLLSDSSKQVRRRALNNPSLPDHIRAIKTLGQKH